MAEFKIPRLAGIKIDITGGDLYISNIEDVEQSTLIVEGDTIDRFVDLLRAVKSHIEASKVPQPIIKERNRDGA